MARVLIVESYPNLASLYHDILSEEGHQVFVAADEKEANEIAREQEIELLLMDEDYPGGGEEALIQRLKAVQPNIKAVLCSLTRFSRKAYRDLCDDGYIRSSDFTTLQQKVKRLSKRIAGTTGKERQTPHSA